MENLFSIIIIILLILNAVLIVWNYSKYNRNITSGVSADKHEDLYDLQYKFKIHTAAFTAVTAVVVYLGLTSYEEMKSEVIKDIRSEYGEIDSISQKLSYLRQETDGLRLKYSLMEGQHFQSSHELLNLQREQLSVESSMHNQLFALHSSQSNLRSLIKDVEEIKKIDFLKQVFLVTGNSYIYDESRDFPNTDTIYFKDLRSTNGNPLPKFAYAPSIVLSSADGSHLSILKATAKYFLVHLSGWTVVDKDKKPVFNYDLLIIYKEP